jgi:hypothetical protein
MITIKFLLEKECLDDVMLVGHLCEFLGYCNEKLAAYGGPECFYDFNVSFQNWDDGAVWVCPDDDVNEELIDKFFELLERFMDSKGIKIGK